MSVAKPPVTKDFGSDSYQYDGCTFCVLCDLCNAWMLEGECCEDCGSSLVGLSDAQAQELRDEYNAQ